MRVFASRWTALCGAVGVTALCAGAAQAQAGTDVDGQAPGSAATVADDGLGDIVITARRREERLQDVPVAVTALSGADLTSRSIQQVLDLNRVTPGFTASQGGLGGGVPRFTIRGQVQFEQLISLDPSVGIYFAEVIQARAHGTSAGFFDLASVEVLRGPQGTLFGRNTTGGAVLITPQTATDRLEGYVSVQLGNYDTIIVHGAVNIPIAEGLSLRLAGRIADRDGYTYSPAADRYFDDESNQSWRATLRWSPADNFVNTLVLNGYYADEQGTGWRLTGFAPNSAFGARPDLVGFVNGAGDRRIAGNESPVRGSYANVFGLANTTTLDLGEVTIKNIFGYRTVESRSENLDFDGSPFFIYSAPESLDGSQYSNEFQLLGNAFDNRLDWIVGAYYFRESGEQTQRSSIVTIPQDLIRTGYVRNISKSIFAQGNYALGFVEGLSLTAGARYTWDDRRLQQFGRNLLNNACSSTLASQPTCIGPVFNADFGAFTYTLGLDWKIDADRLVYIAHRRGYRSGGFNLRANTPQQFEPFNPELVRDIEVGFKADWDTGIGRIRTNLAAYYQWYTNIQRNVTFIDPGTNSLVTSVVNAATAHVSGFEAEIRWRPTRNLEISGQIGHSRLRYDRFEQVLAGGAVQDLSANRIGFAPEWTGGGMIRYTQPLTGNGGELAFQADIYSQSSMQLQDFNVIGGISQPYTLVNFRLEWNDLLGTGLSAAAYLRNAFDETHFTGGIAINGLGPITKNYGPPRTFGVELRIPFGG